ncbi:MAG: Chorismate dehydratase [Chlamydiales bacterium]|nr:Chorismate dehydratase [Chlamydiales bacterium]MCH9620083.1 Chorismate dehydratase [Chlamydiales bacterium]MCH9623036.1 Chorismate dehydratase [Chlamydiales bacterium]
MRVGFVEYSNAYPLSIGLKHYNPKFAKPTTLSRLFKLGEFDLLLSSTIGVLDFDYLTDFCVAGEGKIGSVFLYTKVPPTEISTVKLDPASGSSTALLKILFRDHWKISPKFVEQDSDAFLLIGDPALKCPSLPGYQTIDLATAWYEMTALPFVFAVFLHKEEFNSKKVKQEIETGLEWAKTHRKEFLNEAAARFLLPYELLDDYFKLCHYHLGSKEKEGLKLFVQLINSQ